jgi:HD-GYP domain-containing protein (c-di-GMP phosphodiesterase class II)
MRVWDVWRQNTLKSIGYDVLVVPVAYFFAWFYREHGIVGAFALAVPLIGFRQLYKTHWRLQRAHEDLLRLMVAAIEARDPYTSGHSQRVARNSKAIARMIGLSAKQCEQVGVAALLHDVGKIHEVFAPILSKPDRLTKEEWAIMQTHPVKSAELVAQAHQLRQIVPAVRHHHENWDGSGYPDGLAGEEIPLGARIIIFADTMDAMTSDRPYRRALTESDVRLELERMKGRQFDPSMCDQLLASPQFRTLFAPLGPAASAVPEAPEPKLSILTPQFVPSLFKERRVG